MNREMGRLIRNLDIIGPHLRSLTRTLNLVDTGSILTAASQLQVRQAEISRFLSAADFTTRHTDLLRATQIMHDLSVHTPVALNTFDRIHPSWFSALKEVSAPSSELAALARASLTDTTYRLMEMEPILAGMDLSFLSQKFKIQGSIVSELRRLLHSQTNAYRGLVSSLQTIPEVVQLPAFVLPGATLGLGVSSYAVEVLRPYESDDGDEVSSEITTLEEAKVELADVSSLLEMVDPGLVNLHVGTLEALNGDNRDRQRHVLTSLRTLWDELFRAIAPDSGVTEWLNAQGLVGEEHIFRGRPTRRARLKYILRNVDNDPLSDYVNAQIAAALQLHNIYQRVHIAEPGLTDQQLRVVVLNSEASLEYFIKVWKW